MKMVETVIRASALSSYPDCNRRGAARLFRDEIAAAGFKLRQTPRGIGAAIGTAVHRAAATVLGEKAITGALPPDSVATDCAAETLTDQLKHDIVYDGPRGATHDANEATTQSVSLARSYHRVVAPTVEPLIIEERLEAEVSPGLVLSGQADLVSREPGSIRDLKTGSRAVPGSHAPQVGAYSLLARTHGLDIVTASLDYVRRVRPKKEQPDPLSRRVAVEAAETAAASIVEHIAHDIDTFRHGDPERRIYPGDPWSFQANPSSILCAEKWCPCWGITGPHAFCHEWIPKDEE